MQIEESVVETMITVISDITIVTEEWAKFRLEPQDLANIDDVPFVNTAHSQRNMRQAVFFVQNNFVGTLFQQLFIRCDGLVRHLFRW